MSEEALKAAEESADYWRRVARETTTKAAGLLVELEAEQLRTLEWRRIVDDLRQEVVKVNKAHEESRKAFERAHDQLQQLKAERAPVTSIASSLETLADIARRQFGGPFGGSRGEP
jgi:hypothetical protein